MLKQLFIQMALVKRFLIKLRDFLGKSLLTEHKMKDILGVMIYMYVILLKAHLHVLAGTLYVWEKCDFFNINFISFLHFTVIFMYLFDFFC